MKNEIRLALLSLAVCAAPAFAQNAQDASSRCGITNYDQGRNIYTIRNPAAGAVNQQCFITVYPAGAAPEQARRDAASYFVEGRYIIQLSGGGGGGGGGAARNQGGGGGGAGAAPSQTTEYLSPGQYKMTIGTGGDGGKAGGGQVEDGNPTSLTHAHTGQLIAGFAGADVWRQRMGVGSDGRGGAAPVGGSRGGSGGGSGDGAGKDLEAAAQMGGRSQTSGYLGLPGQSGSESGRGGAVPIAAGAAAQSNAGGGGGAGVGSGGSGESANINSVARAGDLGGGGGGGRGGLLSADAGATGGHGFIRLTRAEK